MKKYMLIITVIIVMLSMSGCIGMLENIIDDAYQNIEVDHFESVTEERIEILVGTEELPDFKDYMNRVTPQGTVTDKSRFDVNIENLNVNIVGEYEIEYNFTSLDTLYDYVLIVYVVEELTEVNGE